MNDELKKRMAELVTTAGSVDNAAVLIKEALDCSLSKSMKLAAGKYQYKISRSEETALAGLFSKNRTPRPTSVTRGKSAAS